MPKVPRCLQCEGPIVEDAQRYVDLNDRRGEPNGPEYVHLTCWEAWKAETATAEPVRKVR